MESEFKLTCSTVTKLLLSELKNLDPITVIIENMGEGRGRIIIECYGNVWSSFWPAMSGTIEEFFIYCNDSYLVNCLSNGLSPTMEDEDATEEKIRRAVCKARHARLISHDDAIVIWEHSTMADLRDSLYMFAPALFGCDWYDVPVPQKANYHYVYLCRIINAVKEGLKEYIRTQVAA
jgi:hypothetical protein